jgi:ABC-type Fe3+ transport system permease subunit
MELNDLFSILIALGVYFAVLAFGVWCAWLTDRRRRGAKSTELPQ